MKSSSALAAALLLAVAMAGLSACEKGPAERAGEAVDKAAKNTGDAVKEAGDKIKDATK
jgi:hypothetical protein